MLIIKVLHHQHRWLAGLRPGNRTFLEVTSMVVILWIVDFLCSVNQWAAFPFYLPPVFEKRWEVLFWSPSPSPPSPPSPPSTLSPPSPRMFCLISQLLLKLAF